MKPETTRYLELLERRIALLGSLAEALCAARTGMVSFDLEFLEARIGDQERLCSEIRRLDQEIDRVQAQCVAHFREDASAEKQCVNATLRRLQEAQASVKQLNDAHQVLLKRSRRTVGALLQSLNYFAMNYADPAATSAGVGERV